jgi:hypothetical protein
LADRACSVASIAAVEDLEFWNRYDNCQKGYQPTEDCHSVGDEGSAFLACLDGARSRKAPQRLRGISCSFQNLAVNEVIYLSSDRLLITLAEGAGMLCLSRSRESR